MTTSYTLNALQVIALTPHIRAYLEKNDPQALAQVERAIARKQESLRILDEIAQRAARGNQ